MPPWSETVGWSTRPGCGGRHGGPSGEATTGGLVRTGSSAPSGRVPDRTTGQATGRPYGFSRRQVERQAPELCAGCRRREACPIEEWARDPDLSPAQPEARLSADSDPAETTGPTGVIGSGSPNAVWLTAESLGDADSALAAHPELPALFVFDEKLLARLRLSAKRLVFFSECLADLALRRDTLVFRGDPAGILESFRPAVTFTPVPGFRRLLPLIRPARLYPWPWLVRPHAGSLQSFSAWRKRIQLRLENGGRPHR